MILDPRIYVTIYIVSAVAYFVFCGVGMATISNDRAQYLCHRVIVASGAALVLAGTAHALDWLWS